MTKLLYIVITILAAWLVVSPFVLGYDDLASIAVAVGVALVGAVTSFLGMKRANPWPARLILGLGGLLAVWGLVGCFMSNGAGLNELIVGLLWLGIARVISLFRPADEMAAYDVYGNPMAQFKKITIKDGNIVMKGVLLGTMPSTMYMRPEEIWKALEMAPFEVVVGLPKFLFIGARRANAAPAKKKPDEPA